MFSHKLFHKCPDKIREKICFQTKYGIFPDSLKNLIQSEKVFKLNQFLDKFPNLIGRKKSEPFRLSFLIKPNKLKHVN